MEKLFTILTDEQKKKIESICDKCIGLMEELPAEHTAFALHSLVGSFEDVTGIKIKDIIVE